MLEGLSVFDAVNLGGRALDGEPLWFDQASLDDRHIGIVFYVRPTGPHQAQERQSLIVGGGEESEVAGPPTRCLTRTQWYKGVRFHIDAKEQGGAVQILYNPVGCGQCRSLFGQPVQVWQESSDLEIREPLARVNRNVLNGRASLEPSGVAMALHAERTGRRGAASSCGAYTLDTRMVNCLQSPIRLTLIHSLSLSRFYLPLSPPLLSLLNNVSRPGPALSLICE